MKRFLGNCLLGLGILGIVASVILLVAEINNPQKPEWLFWVFAISMTAGALAIVAGFVLRSAAQAGDKTGADGRVGNYLADLSEPRARGGIRFEVQYQTPVSGKNGRPSMLIVRMPVRAPTTLTFNVEIWWDRFGKLIGIAREHQTGDAEFDDAIYIRAASEEYAEEYLANPDKRAAILALVRSGFLEVRQTESNIEAVWMDFDPTKNDRPNLTEDAAEVMNVLVQSMPPNDPAFAVGDRTKPWYVLLWVLTILFAVSGAFCFIYPPIRIWDLFIMGMAAFVFEFIAFGALAALILRGTSIAHDRWGKLVGFGAILIGLGSVGSLAAVNALGDTAPTDERLVVVTDKRTSSGRRGNTYYAVVPDWDQPGDQIEFKVSASEYWRLVLGRSKLQLLTGPGRYGIEWLQSQHVLP